MQKTDYIRGNQPLFMLTLVKAIIFTIIVIGVIASMSSCERVADSNRKTTNTWRAEILKNGRLLFVENVDSLPVLAGDTVTVFYDEPQDMYYISNNPIGACDTTTVEQYIDVNNDTLYTRFEAWNVVLRQRVVK
jgi:hypothetical protein